MFCFVFLLNSIIVTVYFVVLSSTFKLCFKYSVLIFGLFDFITVSFMEFCVVQCCTNKVISTATIVVVLVVVNNYYYYYYHILPWIFNGGNYSDNKYF